MVDKVAIVTGGTAGVGRAVVARLLEDGYRVGVIARGQGRLDALRNEAPEGRAATVACDVADADAMMAAATRLATDLGPPVAWVNCAMLTSFSPFAEMKAEEFDRIIAATFGGQVNGTRAALSVMDSHSGQPVIVNVGSGLSYRAVPLQSAYCASKHAINGFTSSLRSELIRAEHPVRLSLVQLPALNTPQFDWARHRLPKQPQPAPPIYDPDVAAKAVMRAIESRPRELFVGQSVLKLVLGDMVLPDWLDRKMADSGTQQQKSEREATGDTLDGNLYDPDPDYPANARGSYGEKAKDTGVILDADRVRLAVFAGLPAVTFLIGLLLG
ncbi:SDR family oxidoreductase [Roseovarius sp. B08]|uniref:SDR family oxidoreductase n=1 Tax=Roseovarius sp. B08 TaxID=3449223 RepID=UPI003EDB9CCB